MLIREKNVIVEVLVERDKIILTPLHIKLGSMKQFSKSVNKEGRGYDYKTYPVLSMDKLKENILKDHKLRNS